MKRFDDKSITAKLSAFAKLQDAAKQIMAQRQIYLSRLDGTPVGSHVIGSIQRMINLDSPEALIRSLHKLSQLAYMAGTTIKNLQGARTDKYIIVKDEILTYVKEMIATGDSGSGSISEDDLDFIVRCIVQNESDPTAWLLVSGSDASTNVHIKTMELYQNTYGMGLGTALPIFDETSVVTILSEAPQYAHQLEDTEKQKAAKTADLANAAVLYSLAMGRVIDHVHALLMETDIWYTFITPRHDGKSAAANIDRGKGLHRLAAYLRGLLQYPVIFNMECALASYELLGNYAGYTPPIPKRVVEQIDRVRDIDIFNAKGDVNDILAEFMVKTHASPVAPTITFFPYELVAERGLRSTIDAVTAESKKYNAKMLLTDLSALASGKYLPLLSSTPIKALDTKQSIAKVINFSSEVSDVMRAVFETLLDRAATDEFKETITLLKASGFKAYQPFKATLLASYQVKAGTANRVENGTFSFDTCAVHHSKKYEELLKDEYMLKIFTDEDLISKAKEFRPKQLVDEDRAASFRDLLEVPFSSLIPSHYAYGTRLIKGNEYTPNSDAWLSFIETISNSDIASFMIKMRAAGNRKLFATSVSGFCCVYTLPSVDLDGTIVTNNRSFAPPSPEAIAQLVQVVGEGQPYGTSFESLHVLQLENTNTMPFMQISEGLYLRFHTIIPVVTKSLTKVGGFVAGRKFLRFQSNGVTEKVDGWVSADAMWDHALFPAVDVVPPPDIVFSSRALYINRLVFVHANPVYLMTTADAARQNYSVAVSEHNWAWGYVGDYARYMKGGSYVADSSGYSPVVEEDEVKKAIVAMEAKDDADRKAVAKEEQSAPDAYKALETNATKEVNTQKVKEETIF